MGERDAVLQDTLLALGPICCDKFLFVAKRVWVIAKAKEVVSECARCGATQTFYDACREVSSC